MSPSFSIFFRPSAQSASLQLLTSVPSRVLSFQPLTNCPPHNLFLLTSLQMPGGVWGSSLPFLKSYLNFSSSQPAFPRKKPFCKSLIFCSLRTLPSSVSRNSFACLPAVAGRSLVPSEAQGSQLLFTSLSHSFVASLLLPLLRYTGVPHHHSNS